MNRYSYLPTTVRSLWRHYIKCVQAKAACDEEAKARGVCMEDSPFMLPVNTIQSCKGKLWGWTKIRLACLELIRESVVVKLISSITVLEIF